MLKTPVVHVKREALQIICDSQRVQFYPSPISSAHSSFDDISKALTSRGLRRASLGELIYLMHGAYSSPVKGKAAETSQLPNVRQAFDRGSAIEEGSFHGPVVSFSGVVRTSYGFLTFDATNAQEDLDCDKLAVDFFRERKFVRELVPYARNRETAEETTLKVMRSLVGAGSLERLMDLKVFDNRFATFGLDSTGGTGNIPSYVPIYAHISINDHVPLICFRTKKETHGVSFGIYRD